MVKPAARVYSAAGRRSDSEVKDGEEERENCALRQRPQWEKVKT